jgi:two-component system chemotaxis response regulator CheB
MADIQQQPVVVAIGASAGGVEALTEVVAGLPPDLACSVLVTLHLPAGALSDLAHILDRSGPLPARPAVDGAPLEPGTITVAVPNRHLTVQDHRIVLSDEPGDGGHRPSIDKLFSSVAADYGPRSIGVVLSGVLDDGKLGLIAIRSDGGTTVVQQPSDALFPAMPVHAIEAGVVDHQVTARGVGALLVDLTNPELSRLRENNG